MFPAQEPQPSVSVAGRPVFQPPLLACAWGMLQTTLPTLALRASFTRRSSFSEWMDTEWPSPENARIFSNRSSISSKSVHFQTVRTGDIFSPEKRSSGPTFSPITIRNFVFLGTDSPAFSAIKVAGLATISLLRCFPLGHIYCLSFSRSAVVHKYPPSDFRASSMSL